MNVSPEVNPNLSPSQILAQIYQWYLANGGGGGDSYVLPPATDTTLGGVKVGSGLSVTGDGTLSASGGSGIVESVVAGTGISVDNTDPANPVVSNTGDPTLAGDVTGPGSANIVGQLLGSFPLTFGTFGGSPGLIISVNGFDFIITPGVPSNGDLTTNPSATLISLGSSALVGTFYYTLDGGVTWALLV